jgi:hypothetical protein
LRQRAAIHARILDLDERDLDERDLDQRDLDEAPAAGAGPGGPP